MRFFVGLDSKKRPSRHLKERLGNGIGYAAPNFWPSAPKLWPLAVIAAFLAVISAHFGSGGIIAVKKGLIILFRAPRLGFGPVFPKIRAQNAAIPHFCAKFDKIAPQKDAIFISCLKKAGHEQQLTARAAPGSARAPPRLLHPRSLRPRPAPASSAQGSARASTCPVCAKVRPHNAGHDRPAPFPAAGGPCVSVPVLAARISAPARPRRPYPSQPGVAAPRPWRFRNGRLIFSAQKIGCRCGGDMSAR